MFLNNYVIVNDFFISMSPKMIVLSQSQPMAVGSDKFRDWFVTQSWPLKHEKSAGQGLGPMLPRRRHRENVPFLP